MTLEQDDPRWVGAWWVGYLAVMVATLLVAPVFFGYPPDPATSLYCTHFPCKSNKYIIDLNGDETIIAD